MDILQNDEMYIWANQVSKLNYRDIIFDIKEFMNAKDNDKIGILYGMRRTGKTTLLKHTILLLSKEENINNSIVFLISKDDSPVMVERAVEKFYKNGVRNFYIDEFTYISDYENLSDSFSNKYANMGVKFLISGTYSLGFKFLTSDHWFDRCIFFRTTYIPFTEWKHLAKNNDIDSYFMNGGILSPLDKSKEFYLPNCAKGFSVKHEISSYLNTSVCENICHVLARDDQIWRYPVLKDLYHNGKLIPLIQHIILDECHKIMLLSLDSKISGDALSFSNSIFYILEIEKRIVLPKNQKEKIVYKIENYLGFTNMNIINNAYDYASKDEVYKFLKDLDIIHEFKYKLCYKPFENKNNILNKKKLEKAKERYLEKINNICISFNNLDCVHQ